MTELYTSAMEGTVDPRAVFQGTSPRDLVGFAADRILDRVIDTGAPAAKVKMGVVQSFDVTTFNASVTIAGSSVVVPSVQCIGSAPLVAGQTVVLLAFGPSYVILGNLGQPSDLLTDTGWVTGTAAITAGSGWTDAGTRVRKLGKTVEVRINVTNNAVLNYTSASGQIADQTVGTLAAAYRPSAASGRFAGLWNNRGCFGSINTSGTVVLNAIDGYGSTSYSYPAGASFVGTLFFFTG